MTMIDWGILIIIFFSSLTGLWRGAVREVFSLATWALSIYLAFKFYHHLIAFYSSFTQHHSLQVCLSFLTILILVLIVGSIIASALSEGASKIGLKSIDKALGLGFGFLRAVLVIGIAIILAKNTELPSYETWKQSTLLPHFEPVVVQLNDWMKALGYDPSSDKSDTQTKSE